MASNLRKPFRAPRAAVLRSKGRKVTDQLDIAKEHPAPDKLQSDKEEAIADGLVWFVKETEVPDVVVEALGDEGAELLRLAPPVTTRDKDKGTTTEVSSPNLAEFEQFMDRRAKDRPSTTRNKKVKLSKSNEKLRSDEDDDLETFENLEVRAASQRKKSVASAINRAPSELLRLPVDDLHSRVVALDDILPKSRSDDDDDVPIVSTLKLIQPKRKGRKKVPIKWTYETVAEPTGDPSTSTLLYCTSLSKFETCPKGAASKYWDADAPMERTTVVHL